MLQEKILHKITLKNAHQIKDRFRILIVGAEF